MKSNHKFRIIFAIAIAIITLICWYVFQISYSSMLIVFLIDLFLIYKTRNVIYLNVIEKDEIILQDIHLDRRKDYMDFYPCRKLMFNLWTFIRDKPLHNKKEAEMIIHTYGDNNVNSSAPFRNIMVYNFSTGIKLIKHN